MRKTIWRIGILAIMAATYIILIVVTVAVSPIWVFSILTSQDCNQGT